MARFVCVAKAILSINPDAQVSVVDNDPERVTFENGTSEIPVSDIKTAMTKLNVTLAWKELRTERDTKLQSSDWRAMPDAPTMSDAWKDYRKKLRDLPSTLDTSTILKTITWPTEPD